MIAPLNRGGNTLTTMRNQGVPQIRASTERQHDYAVHIAHMRTRTRRTFNRRTDERDHMARKNTNAATTTTTTTARKPRARKAAEVVEVIEVPTKVCPFLRAIGANIFEFPATSEFFYKDKSTKDGLAVWSKQGERIYNRGYNARKALAAAEEVANGLKKGTKARKEADIVVAEAQAKVDAAAAEGAFKYGRVKREHGAALKVAS